MQKRSFRPSKTQSPSYPLLRDIDPGTKGGWGLVTLGGLLLGGVDCTPARAEEPLTMGEPPAVRVEKKTDRKTSPSPDAGAPESTGVYHAGRPGAPQIEQSKGNAPKAENGGDKKAQRKGNKTADKPDQKAHTGAARQPASGDTAAPPPKSEEAKKSEEPKMMGKMRMPRVQEDQVQENQVQENQVQEKKPSKQ